MDSRAVWHVSEDVEVTRVCSPCRDLHACQRRTGELDRKIRSFLVAETFDMQSRAQLLHRSCHPGQILRGHAGQTVEVTRRPSSAMRDGGDTTNEQVLDTVSIQ